MRVSHLVFLGMLLIVAAIVILHPWLSGLGGEQCDVMGKNGPLCPGGPRLEFHHVLVALAVGGAGVVSLLGGMIVFSRRD